MISVTVGDDGELRADFRTVTPEEYVTLGETLNEPGIPFSELDPTVSTARADD